MTLNDVYTLEEAAALWGLKYITLKQRFYRGVDKILIKEQDYKRSGKIYMVTRAGMIKLYGPPTAETEIEINSLLDIPGAIENLGIQLQNENDVNAIALKCSEASSNKTKKKRFQYTDKSGNIINLEVTAKDNGFLIKIVQ